MAGKYIMALEEGAMYSSYKEFQVALARFCKRTNSRFTVYDCKAVSTFNSRKLHCDWLPLHLKYKYAKVACERFGQPRHEGKGLRNKGSKKNGCGAHVTLAARKTERESFLIVLKMVTTHSNQCEIRRKQKQIKMGLEEGPSIPVRRNPCDYRVKVSPEPVDNDEDMLEYNYDVKPPMVIYSDDEIGLQKPVPVPVFSEVDSEEQDSVPSCNDDEVVEQKPIPIFHLNENETAAGEIEDLQVSTVNDEECSSEGIKPLPLRDEPSLRDLLLPTMALNFTHDGEIGEQKPIPIHVLSEADSEEQEQAPSYSDDDDMIEKKPIPIFHLTENEAAAGEEGDPQVSTTKDDKDSKEDIKPLLLADKPSLRALLLPAMALNFSQYLVASKMDSAICQKVYPMLGLNSTKTVTGFSVFEEVQMDVEDIQQCRQILRIRQI